MYLRNPTIPSYSTYIPIFLKYSRYRLKKFGILYKIYQNIHYLLILGKKNLKVLIIFLFFYFPIDKYI